MEKISFEQLPEVVAQISAQLSRMEMQLAELLEGKEPENPLMTLQEAAIFLNLAESTIYTKVHRMEIPVIKKGKKLYFEKDKLHNWLMEGRRSTQTELKDTAADFLRKSSSSRRAMRNRS